MLNGLAGQAGGSSDTTAPQTGQARVADRQEYPQTRSGRIPLGLGSGRRITAAFHTARKHRIDGNDHHVAIQMSLHALLRLLLMSHRSQQIVRARVTRAATCRCRCCDRGSVSAARPGEDEHRSQDKRATSELRGANRLTQHKRGQRHRHHWLKGREG